MKEKMLKKITSRKFWVAVSMIVSGLLMMFGFAETSVETIAGAVIAIGGAVGYMIAEGMIDAKNVGVIIDSVGNVIEDLIPDEEKGDGEDENYN